MLLDAGTLRSVIHTSGIEHSTAARELRLTTATAHARATSRTVAILHASASPVVNCFVCFPCVLVQSREINQNICRHVGAVNRGEPVVGGLPWPGWCSISVGFRCYHSGRYSDNMRVHPFSHGDTCWPQRRHCSCVCDQQRATAADVCAATTSSNFGCCVICIACCPREPSSNYECSSQTFRITVLTGFCLWVCCFRCIIRSICRRDCCVWARAVHAGRWAQRRHRRQIRPAHW